MWGLCFRRTRGVSENTLPIGLPGAPTWDARRRLRDPSYGTSVIARTSTFELDGSLMEATVFAVFRLKE